MQSKSYLLLTIWLFASGCKDSRHDGKRGSFIDSSVQSETPAATIRTKKSTLRRELEFASGTNLLSVEYLHQVNTSRTYYTHHSLTEKLITMIDPEFLEQYEGSYTINDLKNNDSESASYTLKSSWVTGKKTPSIGIHIELNPATGNYEVNGGEVFLPESGVGMSYQENQETGESKTFLNWKKKF